MIKDPKDMNVTEVALSLSAALVYQDGWPFRSKLLADRAAKMAAGKLVRSLQGDPELRKILENL